MRSQHKVFGLGACAILQPTNPAIFGFIRRSEDDIVMCVNNLSSHAQAAELDLSQFEGLYPVELLGGERFPRIGSLPYLLTFGAHAFYWFELVAEDEL